MSIPTAWIVSFREAATVATSEAIAMLAPPATVACRGLTEAPPERWCSRMKVSATSRPEMRACATPAASASTRWLQCGSWLP
jgi:hypothetical protein